MSKIKKELLKENILYNLHFETKLNKSIDDIKNGRTVTLEELDKELEALYENSNI